MEKARGGSRPVVWPSAALMAILIIISLWLFIAKPWWFPTLASVHGAEIDSVFNAVLIVTGIAFVVTQALLGYFVMRYGGTGKEKADYWHDNPKGEFFLLTGTARHPRRPRVHGTARLAEVLFQRLARERGHRSGDGAAVPVDLSLSGRGRKVRTRPISRW